jgi:hypothetical protein
MPLSRIDTIRGVDPNQSPQRVLADLCKVLLDTQMKLSQVNNECIDLRNELEQMKRNAR